MYKIMDKKILAPNIYSMNIEAKRVTKAALPGQFIIVRVDENSERIPLTICDVDKEKGLVNVVIQTMGKSTKKLVDLNRGDEVKDFVGPLGRPSEFIYRDIDELKKNKILFVAGGVGAAPIYPQVKWLYEEGINVDIIMGAKTKELVILEEELKGISNQVFIATDDGSYGFHGMVTHAIEHLMELGKEYDLCIAIGPMVMMKFTCLTTKKYNIPTVVSLNPIMVDGTGMCGACRVTVGGEIRFACVDGPEFNGHLVDFDEALSRQGQYKVEEEEKNHHECELGKVFKENE